MILVALQCALLIAAGFALFRLWRVAAPAARWLYFVTAAGFLGRAILGQILFWISWASLPFGRSLQLGNGLWIFASDATFYFPVATSTAEHGWRAILFLDRATASVTYLQLLASMVKLFGSPTSVALLLNLFCYLGTIAILVRWSTWQPQTRIPVAVAITALSLSPALVLWSLQPLKDSFFQLLFVAFVATCAAWQRAWIAPRAWSMRIATGALLVLLLFCIAGIRWYFAAVLIAATALFMSGVVMQSAARKGVSIAAVAMMIVVLTQTFVISAAPYLPPTVASMLTPRVVLAVLDQTRRGFDQTAATTMIRPGARLKTTAAPPKPVVAKVVTPKPIEAKPVEAKPVVEASVLPVQASPPPPPPVQVPAPKPEVPPAPAPAPVVSSADATAEARAAFDRQMAAWNQADLQQFMNGCWNSPEFVMTENGSRTIHGWDEAADALRNYMHAVDVTDVDVAAKPDGSMRVTGTWSMTLAQDQVLKGSVKMVMRPLPGEGWKTIRLAMMVPPEEPPVVAPVAVAPPVIAPPVVAPPVVTPPSPKPVVVVKRTPPPPPPKLPQADAAMVPVVLDRRSAIARPRLAPVAQPSRIERLLAGSAVLVLPRIAGERLGLFHIGGGRGFLWFADIDTLAFDVILLFALLVLASRSRTTWRNPLTWLVLATTLMIFGPLAYSISNFGTLFRLREMIYLGLLLIPLAAATRCRASSPACPDDGEMKAS